MLFRSPSRVAIELLAPPCVGSCAATGGDFPSQAMSDPHSKTTAAVQKIFTLGGASPIDQTNASSSDLCAPLASGKHEEAGRSGLAQSRDAGEAQ